MLCGELAAYKEHRRFQSSRNCAACDSVGEFLSRSDTDVVTEALCKSPVDLYTGLVSVGTAEPYNGLGLGVLGCGDIRLQLAYYLFSYRIRSADDISYRDALVAGFEIVLCDVVELAGLVHKQYRGLLYSRYGAGRERVRKA